MQVFFLFSCCTAYHDFSSGATASACPEEAQEKPCIPENNVVYSPKMALNGKIAETGISEKGAFAASAPVHGPLGSPGSCGVTADGLTPSSVKGNVCLPRRVRLPAEPEANMGGNAEPSVP